MSPFEFSNHNSSSVTPHFSLGAISFFLRKYAKEYLHLRIQCYLCKQNILIWIFLWTFLSIEKENTHIYTPILSGYKKKKQLTVCSLTKLYKCLTYKSSLVCKKKMNVRPLSIWKLLSVHMAARWGRQWKKNSH